jgi:TonB-linked SusC/RagA family outer membrane protein
MHMRKFLSLGLGAVVLCSTAQAQNRTVTGRLTDPQGNPIPNASVTVSGTNVGTVTSASGEFSISVPANARTITVSSVGYQAQNVSIGSRNNVTVTLNNNEGNLNEVVVTGYTVRRRSEFAGAVAKVESKQIAQVPMASFEQILQGRAPGLYIATGSGQPGTTNTRVNIRGVGSISGSTDPLYIIDGVQVEAGVFRTLNPNDFESVDVLKDAVGAGQYGSRGANGVIVVTTKKGRPGRTSIAYRGMTGYNEPPKLHNIKLMNTAERLQYEEMLGQYGLIAGVTNPNGNPALTTGNGITGYPGWDYSPNNPRYQLISAAQRTTEAAQLDSIRQINTNWPDLFLRNGKFQQHEVSASGGAGNLSFYTSLGMFKQEGVIIRSNLERYTFRANVDFKTERLTASLHSTAGWSKQSGIESEAAVALANPVAAAYLELPYRRPYDLSTGKTLTGAGLTGSNALDRLNTTTSDINQFKGNLAGTLQFNIWNGISAKTTAGVDWRNNNSTRFIDPASFAGSQVGTGAQGSYSEGNSENLILQSTTGFVYSKNIGNGKHVINAQAMIEAIRYRSRSHTAVGYGINPNLPNTPAGISAGSNTNGFIPTFTGNRTVSGIFSEFLLADYTYNRRYTISANVRQDKPSQVPAGNRNNTFWGAGATWNIAQETFFNKQRILNDARLRISYGEVANVNGLSAVGDFGYIPTYGTLSAGYAGASSIVPSSPGNPDLRLESQVITNLGTDLAFLNRRLRVSADYYIKKSKNLLVNQGLPRETGFNSLTVNAGQVKNTGFEFKVDGDVLRGRDLIVTVGVNGAFNKNEVTSLGGLNEIPQGTGIIRVGYPLGSHLTVGYLGIDPSTGLPVYQDINGNPTSQYSAANNRAEFGTYNPAFQGGATLDASYKNFDLSVLFTTAQRVSRFNNESFFYESTNSNIQFNKRVEVLTETWRKPGDLTDYQRLNSTRQFSSRDVQDASFVRLRNLQLGYTYHPKSTRFFQGVRLWVQGQNLVTWTKWQGFDPETSNNIAQYNFPNPRTYTVGVDVNF